MPLRLSLPGTKIYILLRLICISACCCLPVRSYARDVVSLDTPRDSLLEVIGYFEKGEKLIYGIEKKSWKIIDNDTTLTSSVSCKVKLEVKDSTSKGYKMDYTFMEFAGDTTVASPFGKLQNIIMDKVGKRVSGTTIHFETDEYGAITEFTNLDEIQKQARTVFRECIQEIFAMPEVQAFLPGIKVSDEDAYRYAEDMDLIDGYVKELKQLFAHHGRVYRLGEKHGHQDETETEFEHDARAMFSQDPENWTYMIQNELTTIIPKKDTESWISQLMTIFADEAITEEFISQFDRRIDSDCTHTDSIYRNYYLDGWPQFLLHETKTRIANAENYKQNYIYVESYSRE